MKNIKIFQQKIPFPRCLKLMDKVEFGFYQDSRWRIRQISLLNKVLALARNDFKNSSSLISRFKFDSFLKNQKLPLYTIFTFNMDFNLIELMEREVSESECWVFRIIENNGIRIKLNDSLNYSRVHPNEMNGMLKGRELFASNFQFHETLISFKIIMKFALFGSPTRAEQIEKKKLCHWPCDDCTATKTTTMMCRIYFHFIIFIFVVEKTSWSTLENFW